MRKLTKNALWRFVILLMLAPFLISCVANKPSQQPVVKIAVAASLAPPLEKIAAAFEQQYSLKTELSFASSGVLTAQIINGAPFDVFISADAAYPQKLQRSGKTAEPPLVFAEGKLILWSKKELPGLSARAVLVSGDIKTLCIADPDLAPFGAAALQWLRREGIDQVVKQKLVYGENIGSVNQFIASGAVDAALTAASARHVTQLQKRGHWTEIDGAEIMPIPHVAVLLKTAHDQIGARRFLRFLQSDAAQTILKDYGYAKPEKLR